MNDKCVRLQQISLSFSASYNFYLNFFTHNKQRTGVCYLKCVCLSSISNWRSSSLWCITDKNSFVFFSAAIYTLFNELVSSAKLIYENNNYGFAPAPFETYDLRIRSVRNILNMWLSCTLESISKREGKSIAICFFGFLKKLWKVLSFQQKRKKKYFLIKILYSLVVENFEVAHWDLTVLYLKYLSKCLEDFYPQ